MGIVVLGAVFVDIKGYPTSTYIPGGRNVGRVEQVPGGVSRNVVEDIANVELRPTFVSLVDDTGLGSDVVRQLKNHKVNTDYVLPTPDGMGTWLAVFDNQGDVCAAISKRPDLRPLIALLDEKGDEIFRDADSIALEIVGDVNAAYRRRMNRRHPTMKCLFPCLGTPPRRDWITILPTMRSYSPIHILISRKHTKALQKL